MPKITGATNFEESLNMKAVEMSMPQELSPRKRGF
jgi:hypothetical protein